MLILSFHSSDRVDWKIANLVKQTDKNENQNLVLH
jgi:hypothetical protein